MLTKEFAQVLINDYRGFIEEIKDKGTWGFLVKENAHHGLCYYAEHTYERDIFYNINPFIPGFYITNNPIACLCIDSVVETLQVRVNWLIKHMGYFPD